MTDGDGDTAQAGFTFQVTDANTPTDNNKSVAAVDDDGLAGGNPASTVGDLNANLAGDTNTSEAVFTSVLQGSVGADGAGSNGFTFATALSGGTATLGQETVTYTVVGGVLTAKITTSPDATRVGTDLFKVEITDKATGAYTVTLLDNVLHAAGPDDEGTTDPTVVLGYVITDADGSETTNNTLTITFDDDAPSATVEASQNVAEGATQAGQFDFVAGADGATLTHVGDVKLAFATEGADAGWSQWVTLAAGELRAKADGSYEFKANAVTLTPVAPVVGTFTVTDGDGDTAQAGFTFQVTDANTPSDNNKSVAAVDDDGLAGGNPASGTTEVGSKLATFTGLLSGSVGADGAGANGFSFAGLAGQTGVVGQETVTYAWDATTNTLTATGPRGALFTVQITDKVTGAYKVELLQNVLHATLDGATGDDTENPATLALKYSIKDADGSETTNNTLTITFDDDAPTVERGSTSVTLDDEAQPGGIAGGAGDSDVAPDVKVASSTVPGTLFSVGADGIRSIVLTGPDMYAIHVVNGVARAPQLVTWTPYGPESDGTMTLKGTIEANGRSETVAVLNVYENGTYTYTQYKPVKHGTPSSDNVEETDGFVFGLKVTDRDGDTASGSLTVKINDDTPVAPKEPVTATPVLDDDAQLGGNAGGPGDVADAKVINRTAAGVLFLAGADGLQAIDVAAVTSSNAMQAIYVDATAGRKATQEAITWTQTGNLATDGFITLTGSSAHIANVAVLTVYADGSYAYEQLAPVVNSTPTTTAAGPEETDSFAFSVKITDGDGDTASSTLTVQINDDTPVNAVVDAITLKNQAGNTPTFSLDTLAKAFTAHYGADGGTVRFDPDLNGKAATGADGKGMVAGGLPITYVVSSDGLVLQAVTNHGTATQTEVFKITLKPATSEYTIEMSHPVDLTSEINFLDPLYQFKGGNGTWNGFYTAAMDSSKDLLLTGVASNGTPSTVDTSTGSGGVHNNWMDAGETMRIDYVVDLAASGSGYSFKQHYVAQGGSVGFKDTSANTAVILRAYDDTNDGTAASGNYTMNDGALDAITALAIMSSSGTTYLYSPGHTPVPGGGYTVTFNADGTANVANISEGTQIAVYTEDGYNRLEVQAVTGADITFRMANPTSAVLNELDYNFKVPLQLVDGDGDLATSQLDITLAGTKESPKMPPQDVAAARVSEEGLPGGLADNVGLVAGDDTTNAVTFTAPGNTIRFSDADSPLADLSFQFNSPIGAFTSGGQTVLWDRTTSGQIIGYVESGTGRADVIKVTMGAITAVAGETGQYQAGYTVTLHKPLDHKQQGEDVLDIDFDVKVFDGQFYSAPQLLKVQIEDDSPVITSVRHEMAVPVDNVAVNNLQAGFVGYVLDNGNTISSGNRFDDDDDAYIDRIQWGSRFGGYSSYKLVDNPAFVGTGGAAPLGEIFKLGDFTHANNPITGTPLDYVTVELKFDVVVNGVTQTLTAQFKLDHTETPNNGPHPDDIITIAAVAGSGALVQPDGSLKFVLSNSTYSLTIKGFRDALGNYVQEVDSKESSTNTFQIYAIVETEHNVAPVSSNIFSNGGLLPGADNMPLGTVEWNAHTSAWGTFTGNADGSYDFEVSDYGQLNLGIGATHTETVSYNYRDADGDLVTGSVQIDLQGYKNWEGAVNQTSTEPVYLQGTNVANTLSGGAAGDYLAGGGGNDTLTGNGGADRFVFNAPLNATTNVDKVTDFKTAEGDKLVLSSLVFEGLSAGGTVLLETGTTASTANPTVLYNNGILSYDKDGNGATAAVNFAELQGAPTLSSTDFVII